MAVLSISRAWEESSKFSIREFGLLFPIAFLLMGLPNVLANLVVPPEQSPEMFDFALFAQRYGIWTIMLLYLAMTLVIMLISVLGSLAISWLALRPGSSVREALGVARQRLLPVFGAIWLVALALALISVPLILLANGGTIPAGTMRADPARMLPVLFPIMVLAIVVGVKLLLLTPVGATERLGPIGILKRSWRLTDGHFWKLLGAMLLAGLVFIIVGLVVALVVGLPILAILGSPQVSRSAQFASDLANAFVTAVAIVFMLPFVARLYGQLAGERTA